MKQEEIEKLKQQRQYREENDYCNQCGSDLVRARIADKMLEGMVSANMSKKQIAKWTVVATLGINIFFSGATGYGIAKHLVDKGKTKQEIERELNIITKIYTKVGRELYYLTHDVK